MPPPRRSRRRSAAAADSPRPCKSARLSVRPVEREDGDAALPLSDEALLLVFSALSASGTTADLVRCAATCRRWRRLVSDDAAFICLRGGGPAPPDPFIRGLALGLFHFRTTGAEASPPRFVPLCPAGARHGPALAAAAAAASRVVASRNGFVVLDLLRRTRARTTHAVRLRVHNPVVGGAGDVLPPLRGRDSPTGPYACTVITAADEPDRLGDSYRVLLLYNRRSFTALRCYSSDERSWGPEVEVTGARIGRTRLAHGLHAAIVHRGAVFWPRLAVGLPLDALRQPTPTVAGFASADRCERCKRRNMEVLLGVTPDGQVLRVEADGETIRAYCGGGAWCSLVGALPWKWTLKLALVGVHSVRLRWLGGRSGVVVFTAGSCSGPGTHVYALDVETEEVRMVATGGDQPIGEVCGYEVDRATLLASLGRQRVGGCSL